MEELEEVYVRRYKELAGNRDKEGLRLLIDAKDAKKIDIQEIEKFKQELNEDTGEVTS